MEKDSDSGHNAVRQDFGDPQHAAKAFARATAPATPALSEPVTVAELAKWIEERLPPILERALCESIRSGRFQAMLHEKGWQT